MQQGQDFAAEFKGLTIVHQKIRGHDVGVHEHADEHEFFLPLQGEITIRLEPSDPDTSDGTRSVLKAGSGRMIYLPPGTPHSFSSAKSGEGERLIAIFDSKIWKRHEGGSHPPGVVAVSQLGKELLFHLLLRPQSRSAPKLIETLIEVWAEMLSDPSSRLTGSGSALERLQGQASDPRLKTALALLAEDPATRISMETLARKSGLSVRSLNRLFLVEIGLTPKQALTLQRIERAKVLLARPRATVTDVALQVGYESVSQFITTFRKLTGCLPSEFQRF